MEVRNSHFAAFIDVFTSNTYVMVISSDCALRKATLQSVLAERCAWSCLFVFIASAAMLVNIRNARKHFEKLEKLDSMPSALHAAPVWQTSFVSLTYWMSEISSFVTVSPACLWIAWCRGQDQMLYAKWTSPSVLSNWLKRYGCHLCMRSKGWENNQNTVLCLQLHVC